MASVLTNRLTSWVERRTLNRWTRLADAAPETRPETLKAVRRRARALQQRVDRLIHIADERLALPMVGSAGIRKPLHTDWAWRPSLWSGPVRPIGAVAVSASTAIGDGLTLFHDCSRSEVMLRQMRNKKKDDLAPYGARIDVFSFDGSYLSLVLDLPTEAVDGLTRNHLVRLETRITTEKPLEFFSRLNVQHGPNTEQIVREVPEGERDRVVEFDLAYSQVRERQLTRAWVDLIFENPSFNEIRIEDVTLTRRPRAAL
ncbi:MAG: DUF6478 family protein [Pseudomonadota bacterium]